MKATTGTIIQGIAVIVIIAWAAAAVSGPDLSVAITRTLGRSPSTASTWTARPMACTRS